MKIYIPQYKDDNGNWLYETTDDIPSASGVFACNSSQAKELLADIRKDMKKYENDEDKILSSTRMITYECGESEIVDYDWLQNIDL